MLKYDLLRNVSMIVIGIAKTMFFISLFLYWWPGITAAIDPLPTFLKTHIWALQAIMIGASSLTIMLMLQLYSWSYEKLEAAKRGIEPFEKA